MPVITPFAALRYTPAAGSLSELLAPPYDVIDDALGEELRDRNPNNAVRLVLPRGNGDARYAAAASCLEAWQASGILARDTSPAVYVYRQRYVRNDAPVERLALFGALELVPLDHGDVLPHERTHAGPKADRLALTLATKTQLSPVFLLGRDPDALLLETLRGVAGTTGPDAEAVTPDGIEHALWVVDEEGAALLLCVVGGRHPLLIADGHHRYETALEVARQVGTPAAGRVLACIVSERDPGLVIQPTHRTLTSTASLAVADLPRRLAEWYEVEELGALEAAAAGARAAEDPSAVVMVTGDAGAGAGYAFLLLPRKFGPDAADRIAAVTFERHVMGDLLGTSADEASDAGVLEYHRHPAEAIRRAGSRGAAFLMPAVRLSAVWEATAAGARLPPKSTYFEPKMPSGLLFRPL